MPQVNLSSLSGVELRQMLDSSRRRGDAGLSYAVLQEMAARRTQAAQKRPKSKAKRDAEPRVIDVDMSDQDDEADEVPPMPNWRPPVREAAEPPPPPATPEPTAAAAAPEREPEPEPEPEPVQEPETVPVPEPEALSEPELVAPAPSAAAEADRPLTLRDGPLPQLASPPLGDDGLRLHPDRPVPDRRAKPPRRSSRFALGLSLGVLIGLAGGLWGGEYARERLAPVAVTPAAAPPRPAVVPPQPSPAAEPEVAATSAPAATALPEATPSPEGAEPAPAPEVATAEPVPEPQPQPQPQAAAAQPSPAAAATASGSSADDCARQATPADRTICGDAHLRRLQADLRDAYNAALDAHEDRALLREHQLAWRDARSTVSDPERLARLYEERIRKLKAATAEARAAR
jgi:uncharacterized protein YecT (DUF1311 family)